MKIDNTTNESHREYATKLVGLVPTGPTTSRYIEGHGRMWTTPFAVKAGPFVVDSWVETSGEIYGEY